MGGSAGALEAFEQFFTHMPSDSGLAFVLVTHMDPAHKGMMPELLGRCTVMKVVQVEESMLVRPNHVYIIPPNKDMSILNGILHLQELSAPRGARAPIRSEEHTSELQSPVHLVCRLLLEKKKKNKYKNHN